MKHLLSIADLGRADLEAMLDLSESFVEVTQREIPKIPALRGKTVVTAVLRGLHAHPALVRDRGQAAVGRHDELQRRPPRRCSKGESLLDTVQTIEAMGVDAIVVRHPCAGAAHRVAGWVDASVINAGDGRHEHPTQALLDLFTLRRHRGAALDGCASRSSATSATPAWPAATCRRCHDGRRGDAGRAAHAAARSRSTAGRSRCTHDLDAVLGEVDVVYLLRIQRERIGAALFPSLREYTSR